MNKAWANIEHGNSYAYRLGCRCLLCRKWKSESQRRYRESQAGRDRSTVHRRAMSRLKAAHREEYDRYVQEELDGSR